MYVLSSFIQLSPTNIRTFIKFPFRTSTFIYKAALALWAFLRKSQKATIYPHRTGETSRTASRSSKTRWRHRCTLKPGQDFSRTSRQKTCPNGHKESEDCHSASVPLRCTPSERQSSSRQQYPRLRPGYIKKKRSGDFRLFPPANFANSAILPTDKISAFFMQNFLLQKPKDSSWLCPSVPTGEEWSPSLPQCEVDRHPPWPERFQLRWHLRLRLGNVSKLPFLSACT